MERCGTPSVVVEKDQPCWPWQAPPAASAADTEMGFLGEPGCFPDPTRPHKQGIRVRLHTQLQKHLIGKPWRRGDGSKRRLGDGAVRALTQVSPSVLPTSGGAVGSMST